MIYNINIKTSQINKFRFQTLCKIWDVEKAQHKNINNFVAVVFLDSNVYIKLIVAHRRCQEMQNIILDMWCVEMTFNCITFPQKHKKHKNTHILCVRGYCFSWLSNIIIKSSSTVITTHSNDDHYYSTLYVIMRFYYGIVFLI